MKNFIDLKVGDIVYAVYDKFALKYDDTDMILGTATVTENSKINDEYKISVCVKEINYTYTRWYDAKNHKKYNDKYKYSGLYMSSVPVDYMPTLFVFTDKDEAKQYLVDYCNKRIEVLSNHIKQDQKMIKQLKNSLNEYGG